MLNMSQAQKKLQNITTPTCLTRENWEKGLLAPLGQPSMGQQ